MAEILITLGIIGVISAITIPVLNTKIRHKVASARLKKFDSTMKQMLLVAEDEWGSCDNWDMTLPLDKYMDRYFVPYLKVTKDNSKDNTVGGKKSTIYFMDGSSFTLNHLGACMDFTYDYNGDASPNASGRDRFGF